MTENPKALPHVVTALITKRTEIAGQIESHEHRVRELTIDLNTIEATLRLFDPALKPKRPQTRPDKTGGRAVNMTRLAMETLRQASGPLTTRDLALHVMAKSGAETTDPEAVRAMVKRIRACVQQLRKRGLARSMHGPDEFKLWEVAR